MCIKFKLIFGKIINKKFKKIIITIKILKKNHSQNKSAQTIFS